MSNLLLVETLFPTDVNFNIHQIIALTPMAMYELDRLSFSYKIPEDYYVWQEDEEHKKSFLKWLDTIDEFLLTKYPLIDVPVAYHCFAMLKEVYDSFYRVGKTFKAILDEEKPISVIMLWNGAQDITNEQLYFQGKSLMARFMTCFLSYPRIKYISNNTPPKSTTNWRDNFAIRRLYDIYRYWMWLPTLKFKNKVLFANPMPLVKKYKLSFANADILWCGPEIVGGSSSPHIKVDDILFQDLFGYPDTKKVIRPRISYFVNTIVPKILLYYDYYLEYLKDKKYSAIFFNRRNQLYQYGLLMAARKLGIKTVYIKHGWEGYDYYHEIYRRLKMYDYFVPSRHEDINYYRDLVKKENLSCEVVYGFDG